MAKNIKANNKKLLQVYIDPTLHWALQLYCLDNNTKNAPVVRELLADFLKKQGYLKMDEKK
ncbi:MAG: hypothetical protein ACOYKC_08115 [Anaerolineaceae bacterium]|jgi:hypothetical protein